MDLGDYFSSLIPAGSSRRRHSSRSSSYFSSSSSSSSSVNGKTQHKQRTKQSYVGPRGHASTTYEAQHGPEGTHGRIRGYKNIDGKKNKYDRVLHPNTVERTFQSRRPFTIQEPSSRLKNTQHPFY